MTEIRKAKPQDAEEIHEIALKSWKDAYEDILPEEVIEEVIDEWYDTEDLKDQVDKGFFYITEKESKLAGFVHATVDGGDAALHRLYVDPDHQREGIGSELYGRVEEDLKENAESVELEVFAKNHKGVSFYEKKGFKEIREEEIEFRGVEARQKIMRKNF